MADEQTTATPNPDFEPGELAAFDYSHEESLELSEPAKKELLSLCTKVARRDLLARRIEVEQAWEQELFKRGYQFLFPRRGGGWQLTSATTGNRNWSQLQSSGNYETNIFGALSDILTAALSRDIPKSRFEAADPDAGPDITAADKAEDFVEIFNRNNDLKNVLTQMADYLCTDGRILTYTRTVLDGQRFGFESPDEDSPVVPEDEGDADQPSDQSSETPEDSEIAEENTSPESGGDERQEAATSESEPVKAKRKPLAREIVTVVGKLGHKVPINTQSIHQMDFVQAYWDVSTNLAKGYFPWIANKIQAGAGSIGEIGIDRLARINIAMAIEGGYQTGDTYNSECTITYTWLRPCGYMESQNVAVRDELFESCPDGLLAAYVGDELAFVRNECMDDHLTIEQALPGTGQNRASLMSKAVSAQRRLNNWIDLINDFFIKTVPSVWMDSKAFNLDAIASQTNIPGQRRPFVAQPGVDSQNLMVQEPMPTHQPALWEAIQFFFGDLMEMLTGGTPALAGSDTDTDATYRGQALRRDSALQRLASPWGAMQKAVAGFSRQAVMCAARTRDKLGQTTLKQNIPGKGKVTLEVSDLKGNILCFPEADSTFPETWTEKASKYQQLVQEAPANPWIGKLLSLPKNMRIAKDASGLRNLDIPEADAIDKQIGEFEILLKTEAQPNPQIAQAQQQLLEAAKQAEAEGPEAMMKYEEMAQQVAQQVQSLPPMVTTVPVMQDASEDHESEAQECFEKMNSPEGRKLKKLSPEIWENLHLHWQGHVEMAQKLKPAQPGKPPSESVTAAVDKMPPSTASQLLAKYYGIQATPQDFMEKQATDVEANITEKKAAPGKTPTPPTVKQPSQENANARS